MTRHHNRQIRRAARPVGLPKPSDFRLVETPIAEPGPGEFRVKIAYVSLDPAMRGWMAEGKSYVPPIKLGELMRGLPRQRGAKRRISSRTRELLYGRS